MLPSIDIFTASVAFFILSLMHMMEMLLLWRMNATLEGPLLWAISLGTGALAFGVLLAEGAWGEIALVLHHSLLILALFFLLEGIFRYNKRPASRLRLRIFFLTYFGLMAALLASLEMEVLRHLITDFTIVAVLLLGGLCLLRSPKGTDRLVHLIPALAFFLYGSLFLARGLGILWGVFAGEDFQNISASIILAGIPWLSAWALGLGLAYIYRIQERLVQSATRDQLTGLYNRRSLDKLGKALDGEDTFTILMADINGFKAVNDTYGHSVGDQVLQLTAQTLRKEIREGDMAIRLGGDEFILFLRQGLGAPDESLLERIRAIVEAPREMGNYMVHLRISLGAATFPEEGRTLDELLKLSDKRMYLEKNSRLEKTELVKKAS